MADAKALNDWEGALGRPAATCAASGEAIAEGADFVGTLELGDEGLVRRDYLPEHFDESAPQVFAFWRGRLSPPDGNRPRPLDIEFLADFFRRLQAEGGRSVPGQEEIAYIVALLLIRKKILVLEETREVEGAESLVVRFAKDEEATPFEVAVPELTDEKVAAIRDDLGRIFNLGETPAPGGAASGDAASASEEADAGS